MKFHNGLVIDTFKYNLRPSFHLPVNATAVIKCTNWKGTHINDNGVSKQALELDIVETNGQKTNTFLVVYDQLCEDIAGEIRLAILEKRAYIVVRISNIDGSYEIEKIAGDKSAQNALEVMNNA